MSEGCFGTFGALFSRPAAFDPYMVTWVNHQTSPQPNFQGPSSNSNEDMGCAGEPLKNENFTKMKNPPKQGDFEGWIIKDQIGSIIRRVHSQIFRALAQTTTKIWAVQGNLLKMRNFH